MSAENVIADKMYRVMNALEGKSPPAAEMVELTAEEAGIILTALTLRIAVRSATK